jgi:hypothetical protein
MLACGFAALTLTAWYFGVLGEVSAGVTIASAATGVLLFLWRVIPRRATVPTGLAVTVGVVIAVSVVGVAVAAPYLDRSQDDRQPTASGSATPTQPSVPYVSTSSPSTSPSETPSPSASATPTLPPGLAQYCKLSLEFLALAQTFSGQGWQGDVAKSDFDPLVKNASAAREVAPPEMVAPMTVLASSYSAARDGWSDSIFKNTGLMFGTILSPQARAAADQVDTYDSEHCTPA